MEHIRTPKVDNVRLVDRFNSKKPAQGTLYLTATHLIFVDPLGKKETWILHMHISSVEKMALTTAGSPLMIRCKTFLTQMFIIPRERDCHDIYTSLLKLSQPVELGDLYAFQHTSPDLPERTTGWDIYDVQSEFLRQGVPNDKWVLTNINKDYELCDTYPRYLFVPASATTPIIMGSAKFRSRGRLPVLSYLHRDNQAAICRCSQPLAGFSARCMEDEQLLQCILRANPQSKYMFVVDTRPKINAMANRAAGKGYENENFYANIKFHFLGIENIHVMRNGLQKLLEVCEMKNPSMNAYLSGLEGSGWLKHIKSIIDTSAFVAKAVEEGISVVVHCSDGWDRTAQTCGLAALLLDPYHRTIQGFQALIEKEWLSFGHKYTDRCGFIGTVEQKETSPVFSQFLDCVWQLTQMFPHSFQFNERYLITLHDHVYSCQFGTFIGNCEKDRVDLRLRERTYSLWSFMSKYQNDFINPFYKKEMDIEMPILTPVQIPQSLKFWKGLYMRFETGIHPRENVMDTICALKDHSGSMREHISLLEKRITSLCKVLGKPEETLKKILQGLTNSESMDLTQLLMSDALKISSSTSQNNNRGFSHEPEAQQHLRTDNRRESDTESGFEDGGSQVGALVGVIKYKDDMFKSMTNDDAVNSMTASGLSSSTSLESLCVEQLLMELKSVAIDWKTFRNVAHCGCAIPFEHYTKKYHCWRCGDVFCTRCIDRLMPLPGHMYQQPVPVCKACYKELKHSPSPSIDNFAAVQSNQTASS